MNDLMIQKIKSRLKSSGLKCTPQRLAVLDFLITTPHHPTADQIGLELKRQFPTASRFTIFNLINVLKDAGLIQEVFIEGYIARYDTDLYEHHHFICNNCEKFENIPAIKTGTLQGINLDDGYSVDSYEIILRGVCSFCNSKNDRKLKSSRGKKRK